MEDVYMDKTIIKCWHCIAHMYKERQVGIILFDLFCLGFG